MAIRLPRRKRRNLKLSLAYRFARVLPLNPNKKLKFLLDLSWIFSRLAHEQIFKTKIQLANHHEENMISSFIKPDSSVLDIGCGRGHVIRDVLRKTTHIIGIDYDLHLIRMAEQEFAKTGVVLICDDVFNYLRSSRSVKFDYIILSHVLEHIENAGDFLKKLIGEATFFYIEVPDLEATHLNLYREYVSTDLIYTDADHVYEFDRKTLEELFAESGLSIIKSEFRFGVMKYWCKTMSS